jgi:hypothetical protein
LISARIEGTSPTVHLQKDTPEATDNSAILAQVSNNIPTVEVAEFPL